MGPDVQALLEDPVLPRYRLCLERVCEALGLDPRQVAAMPHYPCRTSSPAWLAAADARRLAIYLLNTVYDVRQHAIARAVGLTPAAVCTALHTVEDARDHAGFEAVIAHCETMLTEVNHVR